MRPRRLVMRAFGPFAGTETIDFDHLEGRDLLLIEGPTGAGKTSILDAMCYALFGEVPGARDAVHDQLRSAWADPRTPCEVIFDFELRGRTYRVHRLPKQTRKKQRGEGTTIQQPEAHLFDVTGSVERPLAGKLIEVDERVRELLGLDGEQFRQVLLLPQGEFRQFLLADSKDKEKLLERLFETEVYRAVTEHLGEQRRAMERQASEARTAMAEVLSRRDLPDLASLDRAIGDARSTLEDLQTLHARLDARAADAREALAQARLSADRFEHMERLEAAVRSLEAEREGVERARRTITLAEAASALDAPFERVLSARAARADAASRLCAHTTEVAAAAEALAVAERDERRLPELQQEVEGLRRERTRLEPAVALEAEVTAATAALRLASAEKLAALQKAEEARVARDRERGGVDALDAEASRARQQALSEGELSASVERARASLSRALRLDELGRSCADALEAVAAARRASLAAHADATAAAARAEAARTGREAGLAGELAAHLVSDAPCPVCGSCTHPSKATPRPDALSSEEVDALAAAADEARSTAARLDVEHARLDEQASALAAEQARVASELAAEPSVTAASLYAAEAELSAARKAVERLRAIEAERPARLEARERAEALHEAAEAASREAGSEAELARKLCELRVRELRKVVPEGERAEAKLRAVAADQARLEAHVHALAGARHAAATRAQAAHELARALESARVDACRCHDEAEAALAAAAASRGFASAGDAELARLPEAELRCLRAEVEAFVAREHAATVALAELRSATEGVGRPDAEAAASAAEEAAREVQQIVDRAATLRSALGELERDRRALQEHEARHVRLDRQLRVLGRLATAVAGDNPLNMSLQRFVLANRMDEVAQAASLRLQRMSRGRYRLVRTDEVRHKGRQSGLDLEVDDAMTGQTRSVHSLSGGEMFLASLSLALGLADVVTRRSGGVHLDTLFIDEGFGSLDDETLDQVMRALEDLRQNGRLVGMISHVAELKERIPTRLHVAKGERGSTTAWRL